MRHNSEARKKYLTWAVSERRRHLKRQAIEYKGGKCSRCGYCKCPAALQFHHTDPSKKDFHIGEKVFAWVKIQAELDKTILLCANCHHEIHHEISEIRRTQQELEVRSLTPARKKAIPK